MNVLWFVVPCLVTLAYIVYGLTGFGSAVVLIPLLSFLLPLKTVVPLVGTMGFLGALTMGIREYRAVAKDEIVRLVPGMLCGIGIGVYLLAKLPSHWLLLPLGALILWFGVGGFIRPAHAARAGRGLALPVGVLGGLIGGLFGTEGPIYVVYLARRLPGKTEFRATIVTVFIVSTGMRIAGYAASGLMLHGKLFLLGIALYPFIVAGLFIGNRLHGAFSITQVRRSVYLLLIVSGASMLLDVLKH